MEQQIVDRLKSILKEEQVLVNEPMCYHTTFHIGGMADVFIQPEFSQISDALKICRDLQVPYTMIGNGSNLLVSDKGIRGVVIEFGKNTSKITIEDTYVSVQAGALLSKTANIVAEAKLTGLEFAAGIPGTIGGAIVMNAGAYGGEMSQIVEHVVVLDEGGNKKILSLEELDFSYRHSCIAENSYIVIEAMLKLEHGDKEEILARMKELARKRMEKQPLEFPSAGSTFKRPEGYFAGKLIIDAGLRGYAIGGAQIAEKHCGFLINKGGATAEDVLKLMKYTSDVVANKFGVKLEAEVRKLGEF